MNDERRQITKRVMRAMRHAAAREPLADANGSGARHIVVCLRGDSVQYAADRVRDAGGLATVVVPRASGTLAPINWSQGSREQGELPVSPPSNIHPESTMGMVLDLLDACEERTVDIRITVGVLEAALSEGRDILIPA